MQKRGKTAKGTQRWLCINCTKSRSLGHETQKRGRLLDRFVAWLLGKQSQAELQVSSERTWRRHIAWCWQVIPKPVLSGEVYPIILMDATQVGNLVCLITRSPKAVIAWHWAGWESSNTWEVLLKQLPAPTVVVCDGQKGILLTIARCWPKTRIQRCIFHVWQNIRVKLTLHPQTEAGQELLQLAKELLKGITTKEQAALWEQRLATWHACYESFIRERTNVVDPKPRQRKWWYTHGRIRSAYYQLNKLLQDNQLFTYLETDLTDEPIPRTTNYVEGGINSQLKEKLKLHRGLNQTHQQRLVDWYLYGRTNDPKPPRNVL
jgi:hypothetical protein